MFGSNKTKGETHLERLHDKVDTIIGAGTIFVGEITVTGTLRIDGRVEGKVNCAGDVVMSESSVVEAEVHSRSMRLGGTLKGNVYTSGFLEIANTGKLYGDITAGKVIIIDGALFQGQCKMQTSDVASQKKE